jgi:uncharacterized membrane protein
MTNDKPNMGVEPNIGGLLCYAPCCVGLVFSIVAAIIEKKSAFMRFHAFQSLVVHGASFALFFALSIGYWVAGMIFGPLALLVWGIMILLSLALFGLQVFLMMKAHANEQYKLPTISDWAYKLMDSV